MDTGVTDAGLAHLKGLSTLKKLLASDGQFTDSGVKELRRSLPRLSISRLRRSGDAWALVGEY